MKITYTGPNRSSNYAYAQALYNNDALHAFVSGFSRLSPRAGTIAVGNLLERHDFFQTLYVGLTKVKPPLWLANYINRLSNTRLDQASYRHAIESDVFLFYRTQGLFTTRRIHREGRKTICVMEEVNSHAEYARELLLREFEQLGLDVPFEDEPDYQRRLEAYAEVDYILCPSEFVRNSFIVKGFEPSRLLKVNFGFPRPELAPATRPADAGVFRVLYVGQVHFRKGLRYAIEAFAQVQHPRKEFVIVGPQTSITGLEKTRIPPEVVFVGVLKGDALRAEYQRASCFVLPSLEEGLALVQCEALSFGLPVIITTNTGGADIVTDGVEGFVVPPGDAAALQHKLQLLADSPELRTAMSQAAICTVQRLNSWDGAARELIAQLAQLPA